MIGSRSSRACLRTEGIVRDAILNAGLSQLLVCVPANRNRWRASASNQYIWGPARRYFEAVSGSFRLTIGSIDGNSLLDRSGQISRYGRVAGASHHTSSEDRQPFDQSEKRCHDSDTNTTRITKKAKSNDASIRAPQKFCT